MSYTVTYIYGKRTIAYLVHNVSGHKQRIPLSHAQAMIASGVAKVADCPDDEAGAVEAYVAARTR
jgi:hypothetical protein